MAYVNFWSCGFPYQEIVRCGSPRTTMDLQPFCKLSTCCSRKWDWWCRMLAYPHGPQLEKKALHDCAFCYYQPLSANSLIVITYRTTFQSFSVDVIILDWIWDVSVSENVMLTASCSVLNQLVLGHFDALGNLVLYPNRNVAFVFSSPWWHCTPVTLTWAQPISRSGRFRQPRPNLAGLLGITNTKSQVGQSAATPGMYMISLWQETEQFCEPTCTSHGNRAWQNVVWSGSPFWKSCATTILMENGQ